MGLPDCAAQAGDFARAGAADLAVLFYRTFDEMVASMKGAMHDLRSADATGNTSRCGRFATGMASSVAKFSDPLKILMAVVGIVLFDRLR